MARIEKQSGALPDGRLRAVRGDGLCFLAIRLIRSLTLLGLLIAFAGCRTNNKVSLDLLDDKRNPNAADPLRGGGPKPSPNAVPSGQARLLAPDFGGTGPEKSGDAPSPTLGGPTMAALASNSRIGLESPKNAVKTAANAGTKPGVWTPSSGSITWDQAKEVLKARGATWSPPEMGSDGLWHFRCSIPNPENPSVSRVYEASDTSDLKAVMKALANLGS
jgi:hypothetical protein